MSDVLPEINSLVKKACQFDKYAIAKLVSIFENDKEEYVKIRQKVLSELLNNRTTNSKAVVLGFTGMPGAGKSSLLGILCQELLKQNQKLHIAILAIDPSSTISGGSFLGDRVRSRFTAKEKRIFFRSQSTELNLGGIGRHSFQVTRLLRNVFDLICIETVGIGQNEIEINVLSDHTFLVMQPLAGDEIQCLKSGIMEIPDVFIMNKADHSHYAESSLQTLRHTLSIMPSKQKKEPATFMTSIFDMESIQPLILYIQKIIGNLNISEKESHAYFLKKSVYQKFGEFGINILEKNKFDFNQLIDFDERSRQALEIIKQHVN